MDSNHASTGDRYPAMKYGKPPKKDNANHPTAAIFSDVLKRIFCGGWLFITCIHNTYLQIDGSINEIATIGFSSTFSAYTATASKKMLNKESSLQT